MSVAESLMEFIELRWDELDPESSKLQVFEKIVSYLDECGGDAVISEAANWK